MIFFLLSVPRVFNFSRVAESKQMSDAWQNTRRMGIEIGEFSSLVRYRPRSHKDEIRHERWDGAFEHRSVAEDDVLVVDFNHVTRLDHYIVQFYSHQYNNKLTRKKTRKIRSVVDIPPVYFGCDGGGRWCCEGFRFTHRVAVNDVVVVDQPGVDGDKVGDKTGYTAFEHGAIPADHVLQVDIRLVRLVHH